MLAVRTSAEIKSEIQAKFGFVPPFFEPAESSPQVFENLWQQTLLAYVSNPLAPLFKEKLSAYLSRYCAVPYCMVCHSCSLRPLGMQAKEVLELLESPPPTELEIGKHLKRLAAYAGQLTILPEPHSDLEESLLACSVFITLEQEQAEYCRVELRRILGPENYQHLVTFSAYVKTCHAWMEAHPEVAYETDQRVQNHLSALLAEAPGLKEFFDTYVDRVRQERRLWAERLAEIREQKRQEQRFRLLTEAIPQQVWTAQPDGRLDYVNQRILDYFDRSFEEMIGWGWQTVIHPEDLPQCLARWQTALATGTAYEIEFRLKSTAGDYRWHLTRALPLRNEHGQIVSWLGTNTDIHDRKQANEILEQRVKERTAQLEVANQELDSFSYSVSHDLRAPLRHISGFVVALHQRLERQGSLTDPKVTHYLEVIQSSSQKMGQLIDGLLTLSRLGRRQLTQYPVELGPLVQTVVAQAQAPTGSDPYRQVEFQIAPLPTVMGDATLLQQVFSNLIDNAVKFSGRDRPARVAIGALADGTLFVQDNGVGFQMEHADQLFGPFQRLHSQQEFEGTGIGLAIVQRIAHRHGGEIWAESQPGQGTTFYLKLRPVASRT